MTDAPQFLDTLDRSPGLFGQVGAMFRGPMGRLTLWVYAMAILTFALGLWIVTRMLHATDTRMLILWTAAGLACWASILMMKLWIWSRLNTLAILRAIDAASRH